MPTNETGQRDLGVPTLEDSLAGIDHALKAPQERAVLLRIHDFLTDLAPRVSAAELETVADALNQMISLHDGQEREPGVPYYRHPLLVTILAAERFGLPVDPVRAILTSYHDVPEDQATRVGAMFSAAPTRNAREAIEAIAARYGSIVSADRIREGLTLLTNPDFKKLIKAAQDESSASPEDLQHAKDLLMHAGEIYAQIGKSPAGDPAALDRIELGRLLYLGHFREIKNLSAEVFQVKLADFYTNGMHLHLLREKAGALDATDPNQQKLTIKADKLALKYGPVVEYLMAEFDSAAASQTTILGSAEADRWYRRKLAYVWEHGYNRA